MREVYNWIEKNREATRILALAIPTMLVGGLSVPAFLFIPGFLDNLRELHRLNSAGFYGVLVLAGIATTSAVVWSLGNAWQRMGEILYPSGEQGAED